MGTKHVRKLHNIKFCFVKVLSYIKNLSARFVFDSGTDFHLDDRYYSFKYKLERFYWKHIRVRGSQSTDQRGKEVEKTYLPWPRGSTIKKNGAIDAPRRRDINILEIQRPRSCT